MTKRMIKKIWGYVKLCLLVVGALAVCWRGATFEDAAGISILPIVMCLLMALSLGMVWLSLVTKAKDPLFI